MTLLNKLKFYTLNASLYIKCSQMRRWALHANAEKNRDLCTVLYEALRPLYQELKPPWYPDLQPLGKDGNASDNDDRNYLAPLIQDLLMMRYINEILHDFLDEHPECRADTSPPPTSWPIPRGVTHYENKVTYVNFGKIT